MTAGVGTLRSATRVALRSMFRAASWVLPMVAGLVLVAVGLGPRLGAYQTLTVLTGSMRPSIAPGSLVVVTPVPAESIRVGDVVTLNAPIEGSPVVTHRIVEIVETGATPVIRTKGDANSDPDPWLARVEGGVVWKARADVPYVGSVLVALRSKAVRPALLYVIPALVAIWWLAEIWGIGRRRACSVRPRRGGMPRTAVSLARGIHA